MWRFMTRLMAPAGGDGSGGGGGSGDGGAGGKPGGDGGKPGEGGTILSSGGKVAGAGGGDDKAGGKGAGGGTGDGDAWNWGENIPGAGVRPPWLKHDKYKTVEAQARAAAELETKLGPHGELIGAPVDDKGQPVAYKLPEFKDDKGQPLWEWDTEDPALKGFQAEALAMGLSQKAFERVISTYAKAEMEKSAAAELQLSEALQKAGPNIAVRVQAVEQFVTAKVGPDGFKLLDNALGTNVAAFQAFEKIVALASNDARLAGPGGKPSTLTKADIQAEQFKTYDDGPLKGQKIYDHDAQHRAKVDKMWAEAFPGDDFQNVG